LRNVIVSEFVTLDGVIEGLDNWPPFQSGSFREQELFKADELSACSALLLGRVTYQIFAASWPTETDDIGVADRMNSLPKYVVSRTLQKAEWNASLIKDDLTQAISRIKQEGEGDVLVYGSCDLVHSLEDHHLIDEYRLVIYPVVVGSGKRLFREGTQRMALKLVEVRPFASGTVLMRYQPDTK
jgi:dihydrofolate reductase